MEFRGVKRTNVLFGALCLGLMMKIIQGVLVDDFSDNFQVSNESLLVRHLMDKYKRAGRVARPVLNSSATLRVEFALALIQILDFDETNQVLTTNVWKRYRWQDELMVWDPANYGGISDINLPSEIVWTPDIVLYNNADEQEKSHQELVAVYHYGIVRWIPPAIFKSSCKIDMRNFPFDEQTCHFKFGSWTYNGFKLHLDFYEDLMRLDMQEYVESSEWIVLDTAAEHHVRYYECCGEEPWPDITFCLTVQRRTGFYIYVLILPSVLLSTLTLVLFWIPPQRPDRTSLGMSLFSSFFVLLLILVQSSPPTSASISLLGLYYCINMVMLSLSTMLSALVINLTTYLQRKPVPKVIRLVFISWLARVLCATDPHSSFGMLPYPRDDQKHEEEAPMMASNLTPCTQRANGNNSSSKAKSDPRRLYQHEWKIIAVTIDRIFFLLYVVGIILSLVFFFPRYSTGQKGNHMHQCIIGR